MAKKIEVCTPGQFAALGAAEYCAVELACLFEVIHGEGEVKQCGGLGHRVLPGGWRAFDAWYIPSTIGTTGERARFSGAHAVL
jgi:hypothetical protein